VWTCSNANRWSQLLRNPQSQVSWDMPIRLQTPASSSAIASAKILSSAASLTLLPVAEADVQTGV